jgi:hypothetical protein
MTLGLVDLELRVIAPQIGLEHDVDRRPDVLLGVGAVDVRARDVREPQVALDAHGTAVGVGIVDRGRAANGSTSIRRRLARAAPSRAAYSSSSVSASTSLSS